MAIPQLEATARWKRLTRMSGLLMFAASVMAASTSGSRAEGAPQAPRAAGAASRTVLAGVYTTAQAKRGERKFAQICAECHTAPEFSGSVFQQIWKNRSVGELYKIMSTMMPQSNPGSLTHQEYADIATFFLQQNEYPAGDIELPPDQAVLDAIVFQPVAQ